MIGHTMGQRGKLMKTMSLLLSATSALLATAMPASAATLLYTFTTTTSAGATQSSTFNVDSTPVVFDVAIGQFSFNALNFVVNSRAQTAANSVFSFFTGPGSTGGFNNPRLGDLAGAQLYTGSTSTPVLQTGTFALTGGANGRGGTLVVTTVAAIPEPATWAMMAVGFGLAASAMRRRKVTTRVSYAASRS
jgi:hypothetical protein